LRHSPSPLDNTKVGAPVKMDIKEVTGSHLLMEGLDKAVEMMNIERKNHYRMVRHSILAAKKQVVSGMLYKVIVHMVESSCENVEENDGKLIEDCPERVAHSHGTNFEISMWSRPWIKDPAQSFIIKIKLLLHAANDEVKVGGPVKMDIKEVTGSQLLMGGLDKAVEMMNHERKNHYRMVRHSILAAKKQVVSGHLYKVIVHMVESSCENVEENDGKMIEECPERIAHSHGTNFEISMWSRPWIKDPAQSFIIKIKLLLHAANDGGMGGQAVDMDIKEVMGSKLLMGGLDHAMEMMNADRHNPLRIVRHSILEAKKQVVSGMLYRVIVHFVNSSCKNVKENDGKTIEECPEKEAHSHGYNCVVSMWSRPWIKDPAQSFIVTLKCLRH